MPNAKITDFGLAKLLTGIPADGPTQSGAVVGTPGYMAPEQAAGHQRQVGPAADVYALGAILYECLTGRPPFQAATTVETLLQVMHDEPVSISKLQPGVPRDLATIAMRCLEKQPIKRYASARDLADDLDRFLAGQSIHARRVGPLERGWRWCKRNPVVAGLASGLLVALVLGIAGVSWKWWEAEQRRRQAEASADAEKLARQREADQRARAEKASDRTRQVLDAMVSGVTGDSHSTQKAITDEQKKFLSGVLSYYQEFAGEEADDEKARARTANAAYRVGFIESRLGRKQQGLAAFRMACDGYEKLAADFPAVSAYQVELGGSYCNLGNLMGGGGKSADSLAWFQKAPGNRAIRTGFKLQAGQAEEAVAEAEELTKSPHWNAGALYEFACVYAVASGKVVDKKQPYADRAMALLHKAVKAGYRDAAHMKEDNDAVRNG
jgi:hypothetical protein